jgi:hypothetical protein
MATNVLQLAEQVLARAASDPSERPMTIARLAEAEYYSKFDDTKTPEEWEEVRDEHHTLFRDAERELTAVWGNPYYSGPSEECPELWGPLGEQMVCWERGEFAVCLYFGVEDSGLPISVDLAAVRRDADW